MTSALEGVRIADFTQLYQGPLATQILSDLGAEITKFEPLHGDFFRRWSLGDAYIEGESVSFLAVNRNKKSISLDLKSPEGLDIARRIIGESDVVIENFRPGVMDRLGLGYEELAADLPDLIYCSSSGYGTTGPYANFPGQDLLIQALTGTMWLNGRRDDPPTAVGFGLADVAGGLHIVMGVLAALYERSMSGQGQKVEVNLLDSMFTLLLHEMTLYANTQQNPERPKANTTAAFAGAPLGVYQTADGYIAIAMMPIAELASVLGLRGLDGNLSSNDIPNRDEIHHKFEEHFMTAPAEAWLAILRDADVWCAPVQTLQEATFDPQVIHNEVFQDLSHPYFNGMKVVSPPIRMSRTPPAMRHAAPLLGQHTHSILRDAGYSEKEIELLENSRVISSIDSSIRSQGPHGEASSQHDGGGRSD